MNGNDKHWGTVQSMYSNRVRLDLATTYYYRHEPKGTDQQAYAKELWDKFMDEHSHGLVVSELPRYLKHKKDGQLIELNDLKVLDPSKWDSLTLDVRYEWKDQLKLVDRFIEANAEDPDELKSWKATKKRFLTIAKKLESWTYKSYVEPLPKGNPNDLGNVRHYRLPALEAIPMDFPTQRLKVEFWHRLLVLWDGPENKKADNVRAFLTHHHTHGNNPERFRDLVAETVKIFRDRATELERVIALPLTVVRRENQTRNKKERIRFEVLADKMQGWYATAATKRKAEIQDQLTRQTSYVLMRPVNSPLDEPGWLPTNSVQRRAIEHIEGPMEPADFADRTHLERFMQLRESFERVPLAVTPFGTPWDGGKPMDLRNPYRLEANWNNTGKPALICENTEGVNWYLWQFRCEIVRRWESHLLNPDMRSRLLSKYLNHHAASTSQEAAFLSIVEKQFFDKEPRAPLDIMERIKKGELDTIVPEQLKVEIRAWLDMKRLQDKQTNEVVVDLKRLALCHAFRYLTGDKDADITHKNCQELAINEGSTSNEGGKQLLKHFSKYTQRLNSKTERLQDGKSHTVKKRYINVIADLLKYENAAAMATNEGKEIVDKE